MVFRNKVRPLPHGCRATPLPPQFLRGHAPYAARLGTRPRLSGGPLATPAPPSYVTTTTETRPTQVNVARTASR